MLASNLSDIAELTGDSGATIIDRLGPYAKSALYYSSASQLRFAGKNQAAIEMLSDAIIQAPNEPTFYYFRARWKYEIRIIHRDLASHSDTRKLADIEKIAIDLETAISFESDWEEPKRLLSALRG